MGIPSGSNLTETASVIYSAFVKYNDNFIRITKRAKERFEKKDFSGSQKDVIERIALYDKSVTRSRSLVAHVIGSKGANTEIWERLRVKIHGSEVRISVDGMEATFWQTSSIAK